MEPEFTRLVHGAADIATSGRWAAINARIQALAAGPDTGNGWWVSLFASLCSQNFMEYLALKHAYESTRNGDTAVLAWRARNLLELSIWSTYCAQNRENARRFYEDAGRDVRETLDAFSKWGAATAQAPDWLNPLAAAKQDLAERAKRLEAISSLEGPYQKVIDAAKECGLLDHFRLAFKMLSKFAHPSAMRIMAQPDDEREALQRDCFFSLGCLFFTGAFTAIEGQLHT